MQSLITITNDNSLQKYELEWLENYQNSRGRSYNNPTATLYTSMVYSFARHLPYSMDIEQPEYVPADFLNMTPHDVEENNWFKWEDRRTFFNAMINWQDTRKSGMLLQVCNIFQKMILGKFPTDFELKEEDYVSWHIDTMTKDQEYNRSFFEALKSLPNYYQKVINSTTNEERRDILNKMYQAVMTKIEQKLGGYKETESEGNIIRETKASISISPFRDIEMLVYWDNIVYHDGIESVKKTITEEHLKIYDNNIKNMLLKSTTEENFLDDKNIKNL